MKLQKCLSCKQEIDLDLAGHWSAPSIDIEEGEPFFCSETCIVSYYDLRFINKSNAPERPQFIVMYKGKDHYFNFGSEVYIFHSVIYSGVKCIKKILSMVDTIQAAYLKDDNRTPLGALADYVAENWNRMKKLSRNDILYNFYMDGGAE